ncbi:uncharacterized protein RCC_04824 [Ramularia collo-cygni]|uniref:Uncharacterized protein n=1 Tax=Ramularia collo-cygni TaxID=112498 RepID=A0A2D3VBK9_9PEZI|nr:uncharacterized protein RCC_04824 [Ramularia collo-cygni]CZT18979.1 uncharacterized protein RCC_04824 [Ramularia collo-cygni]
MAPIGSLITLLIAGLAVASPAPVQKRELITADLIISNVDGIDNGVEHLRSHVAAYDGSLLSASPLVGDFLEITVANRAGFTNANLKAAPFDAADSTRIVDFVIDSVGHSIPAAVKETVAKKELFVENGQGGLISGSLNVLLYEHDSFSAALQKKISADQVRAQAVVDKIHNAIQSGIDAFAA